MLQQIRFGRIVTLLFLALALASCGSEEDGGSADDTAGSDTDTAPEPQPDVEPPNTPPTLSGSPTASVVAGSQYRFTPNASDADGDDVHFAIENKPGWASFDSATGQLIGTPGNADVGIYSDIRIGVTDGEATTHLDPFTITVHAIGLGAATLSWAAPTQRTDGSPLTDLAGYKVYWGTESRNYSSSVEIDNPAVTTYIVDNLGTGTHYFATTALSADGLESEYSNEASKTVP